MASGVKISDQVTEVYNEMRLVKNDSNSMERIRLVVFQITNDEIQPSKIFREKDVQKENVFKLFQEQMDSKCCCYLLYDCHYETKDSPKEELVFVMWTPDTSVCKEKMLYASSKRYIRDVVSGIKHEMQINDRSDAEMEEFADKLGKNVLGIEGNTFGSKKK